jgi:hypothetical protein
VLISGQPDDFLTASGIAVEGDALYRAQNFDEAEALYQQALDSLIALEARLNDEIDSRLALLLEAIESGDETTAGAIAPLVEQMAPDSDAVFDAVERVPLMPDIADLEAAAKASFEQGRFSTAGISNRRGAGARPRTPAVGKSSSTIQIGTDNPAF